MHFSKTYGQLLLTLPKELRDSAIEYRRLKKLINQVVLELTSLGLSPEVLHGLLHTHDESTMNAFKGKQRAAEEVPADVPGSTFLGAEEISYSGSPSSPAKIVYEFINDGNHLEPRLRLRIGSTNRSRDQSEPQASGVASGSGGANDNTSSQIDMSVCMPESRPTSPIYDMSGDQSLPWTLQQKQASPMDGNEVELDEKWNTLRSHHSIDAVHTNTSDPIELASKHEEISVDGTREIIIPLVSDTAFFQLLSDALKSLTAHLAVVQSDFIARLDPLARKIAQTARPQSSTSHFHPHSSTADPSSVHSALISPFPLSFIPGGASKSDLYPWREIFQLYVEAEVFESLSERDRGERVVEDSEKRLALFTERMTGRGLNDSRKLKLKESRKSLETFLELNVLILNLQKFQYANSEATRKIIKKHTKRTALPLPKGTALPLIPRHSDAPWTREGESLSDLLALIPTTAASLPHILVQAIGEILLPVIPHINDYDCLICTSIAFKPIRLACGHLFCVRCLVKMQKRGQDSCPVCRAGTVLQADRTNVDWALLNFMQDWFPKESRAKLKQNEREAAKEELEELGLTDQGCIIV